MYSSEVSCVLREIAVFSAGGITLTVTLTLVVKPYVLSFASKIRS